jgi:hypothetical protein
MFSYRELLDSLPVAFGSQHDHRQLGVGIDDFNRLSRRQRLPLLVGKLNGHGSLHTRTQYRILQLPKPPSEVVLPG